MNRTLAEAARRLKPKRGLPRLIAITDGQKGADIAHLPRGAVLILRDYDHPDRAGLGRRLRHLTRARGIKLLVAGDPLLARRLKADGLHLPEFRTGRRLNLPKSWLITAAAHGVAGLRRAEKSGVVMILLSPVFVTASHPDARPLGLFQFRRMMRLSAIPVAALGGVTAKNARALIASGAVALAGIRGFSL